MANQLPVDGGGDMEADSDDVDELVVQHAIGHAQQGIWSGQHHRAVEPEDEESEGNGSEDEPLEASENEDYEDWDDFEDPSGLSALDQIGEDFERNAAANGEFLQLTI
jgi:hypothetical protein